MNFTDPIPQSHCAFSNQGSYIAIAKTHELFIFESDKMAIRDKFVFADSISAIDWSPDDAFIMVVIAKKHIQVRCINPEAVESKREGWACKIDEGVLGMVGQFWAPDSRQLVTVSDLQLRATVWSLVEQRAIAFIKNPKHVPPRGFSITKNKKFIAVAERKEARDWVSIYYTGNEWKLVNTFEVDTFDLADLMWCKEDSAILVWDSALESRFLVYSALTGDKLVDHKYTPTSQSQLQTPGSVGLGIKSLSLSPNGLYLIAAFFETKMRLYNGLSMKEIAGLDHMQQINLSEQTGVVVYREEQSRDNLLPGSDRVVSSYVSIQNNEQVTFDKNQEQQIVKLPLLAKKEVQAFNQSTYEKAGLNGPPTGVSLIQWSHDSRYLATKCDQMPNCVYLWDMHHVELHSVLIHTSPVKSLAFAPQSHHLAITTGQPRFHVWTPTQAMIYELTQDSAMSTSALFNTLALSRVKWNVKHNKLMLMDKNQVVIGIAGYDFMQAGQNDDAIGINTYGEGSKYLGATASKFVSSGGGLLSQQYSMR
ncbi:hypothetical protein FGO68_gene14707 [Halteria grandinella]|uniref:Uncharacterized protein n=1 Tax=Halteria grandinella TaxID=5974 RepID=A0A8J8NYY2_HALGN|nr:hypothetical protein FGO68_gene14707 [Halteria grandinella]